MAKNNASQARLVTMPADWWAAFAAAAKKDGCSLSEWIGEAGRAKLPAVERRALSERKRRGRPKVN